ncbi:MAG: Hin recombinase [Clostridiales bacterium]|nr:Hin recombinase [Clostridiales bacterium]MCC8104437.1 Hin recombinase [Clostridiales bacterium]
MRVQNGYEGWIITERGAMYKSESYGNPRRAGRRKSLSDEQLEQIRQAHSEGQTITALAKEYGISRQTLSGYLNADRDEGLVCRSLRKWEKLNQDFTNIPVKEYTMRMEYMSGDELCSVVLIDFKEQKIAVKNYTMEVLHRAFGIKAKPDWMDFESFLEDRCFPKTRDHLKLVLSDLGLDFYDPLAIIEKTQGRMAEDSQWIQIWYFRPESAYERIDSVDNQK